jgi:hypothetical protein
MTPAWAILVYMAAMGASFGLYSAAFGAIWPELYGTRHLGAIKSAVTAMMVLCTALGPGISGWLIDAGVGFPSMVAAMGFYAVAAAMLMILAERFARQRVKGGGADQEIVVEP